MKKEYIEVRQKYFGRGMTGDVRKLRSKCETRNKPAPWTAEPWKGSGPEATSTSKGRIEGWG